MTARSTKQKENGLGGEIIPGVIYEGTSFLVTMYICICTSQTNLEKSTRTLVVTNCFLNRNSNVFMAI